MSAGSTHDQTITWQGIGNLANALRQVDQEGAFDRCIVGTPHCSRPPIQAHSLPRTALRLIADSNNEVVATDVIPATHIPTYFNTSPLRNYNINQVSIGKWACQEHDGIFAEIDSQSIDCQNPRNLFLLVYRATLRILQAAQRMSYRMAMTLIDPARDRPSGIPEYALQNLQDVAIQMSVASAEVFVLKTQLDKMLTSGEYDNLEYRVASWETTSTLAACGMKWFDGERRDTELIAAETEAIGYPARPNMITPGWIIILPQQHGQIAMTASTNGKSKFTSQLHEGMPKNLRISAHRGRNWTNLISRKAITMASDLVVSLDHYLALDNNEKDHLQKYLKIRSSHEVTEKNLPNLLAYEQA